MPNKHTEKELNLKSALWEAANIFRGSRKTKFSVARYGNVMGSRGSVIPIFLKQNKVKNIPFTVTDREMTRFNISLTEGVEMVLWAIENSLGGEIFVPKIPSYRVIDVAEAIGPNCKKPIVGIRPGEKIHEEMITTSDSYSTIDLDKYYAILPTDGTVEGKYRERGCNIKHVQQGFAYNSGTNPYFLGIEEIRSLITKHVNKDFEPI